MASLECFQWRDNGSCPYGENCRFLHGDQPTRATRRRQEQICFTFRDKGTCEYGDNCRFSHQLTAKPSAPSSAPKAQASAPSETKSVAKPADAGRLECYNWKTTGTCSFGSNCRYLHGVETTRGSRVKGTQICYKFKETGHCEYGPDCRFSHDLSATTAASADTHKVECREFAKSGNCKWGDACRFSHSPATAAAH